MRNQFDLESKYLESKSFYPGSNPHNPEERRNQFQKIQSDIPRHLGSSYFGHNKRSFQGRASQKLQFQNQSAQYNYKRNSKFAHSNKDMFQDIRDPPSIQPHELSHELARPVSSRHEIINGHFYPFEQIGEQLYVGMNEYQGNIIDQLQSQLMINTQGHEYVSNATNGYSSDENNSIDEFIKNDYVSKQINDSDYLSDESLKNFLKKLTNQAPAKTKEVICKHQINDSINQESRNISDFTFETDKCESSIYEENVKKSGQEKDRQIIETIQFQHISAFNQKMNKRITRQNNQGVCKQFKDKKTFKNQPRFRSQFSEQPYTFIQDIEAENKNSTKIGDEEMKKELE